MCRVLETPWLRLSPVCVGRIPAGLGTPERYATVEGPAGPILRVDVYAHLEDQSPFEAAIVWHDSLVIGYGKHVHAVSMATRESSSVSLESCFSGFYSTSGYLLIASAQRLYRMEPDRSITWASEAVGVDGVLVDEPGPPEVRGRGEWDPPGGWRPFALRATDGGAIKP